VRKSDYSRHADALRAGWCGAHGAASVGSATGDRAAGRR